MYPQQNIVQVLMHNISFGQVTKKLNFLKIFFKF